MVAVAVAVAVAVENAAAWCLWGMGTATPRRTWPETGMLSGLPASKLSIAVRDGQAGSCYATAGRLFPLPWLSCFISTSNGPMQWQGDLERKGVVHE